MGLAKSLAIMVNPSSLAAWRLCTAYVASTMPNVCQKMRWSGRASPCGLVGTFATRRARKSAHLAEVLEWPRTYNETRRQWSSLLCFDRFHFGVAFAHASVLVAALCCDTATLNGADWTERF
jgi:hypothetical protein